MKRGIFEKNEKSEKMKKVIVLTTVVCFGMKKQKKGWILLQLCVLDEKGEN
jgi:hypothetical protein